jgi:SAM-dependent methyltransferase/glycosyltransferase involved in cell wall biosynthesis
MRRRQVLVCGPSVVDPDRQSGSRRTADQIEFLLEDGWLVTFAGSDAGRERYARALRQKGVRTVGGDEALIEELVTTSEFDLALIAFWYTAERYLPIIRRASPQTRFVVDSIDLHFLRATRGAFLDGGSGSLALSEREGSMFVRELNTYSAADAVLAVSEKEAATIDDLLALPGRAITIPDCEEGDRSPFSFEERAGILFIGNFEHPPNVGAVEFLCNEIAPRVSSTILERHPISVVGNALDGSVRRLCEQRAGVNPIGWVPSVHPYLDSARVSVVPLLYGAGTKRKLIQALRAGTPTVSTSAGVEGLGVTPGSEVLVADDPQSFADSVERLVEDETLWSRLADAGRSLIEPAYSRETAQARFRDAVVEILQREPNVSAASVPATAIRVHAPLPDPPRSASRRRAGQADLARPLFIVGSPRSGTSVLTWALGQHPNILPLAESDWLAKLGADVATSYALATRRGDRSAFGRMGISRASLYSAMGRAVDELICSHRERYAERSNAPETPEPPSLAYVVARSLGDPKARWIDGTPEYSHSIVPLRRLFPGAVFIHLLRDVREVVESLVHFHAIGGARFSRQDAYGEWLRNVNACVAAEQAYGSAVVLRVRHSDLASRPEEVVRRCLTFVGETYASECLEPLETKLNSSHVPVGQRSLAAEDVSPDLREEAESLSDHLLSEEFPSYGPAPDKQAELESAYDARVPSLEQFFGEFALGQPSIIPNLREPGEEMRPSIMKSEWDERARLNPMHYIASSKVVWDEKEFFSGGAGDVDRYIGSDLEAICAGREARAMRMLEIGCGIGRMTRHLAEIFGEVHGVDVAPTMVSLGQEKMKDLTNVYLHETNGTDLGMFDEHSFDFAFSYIVFQHVPFREAVVSYFREVHRTLKPGCLFKFQVQGAAIERPDTWVGVGFSAAEMQRHAQEIGFEPLREEGAGTQYYWHWWRRI